MSKINYASISKVSVDRLIELAADSANTMQKKVQVAAVGVLVHAKKTGDYSKAQALIDALGSGVRSAALVDFFVKFGGLVVSEEEKGFSGWNGKAKVDIEAAKAQMWWDLKVPNPYAGFNLKDALDKLLKSADQASKKEGSEADKVDIDDALLAELKKLAA